MNPVPPCPGDRRQVLRGDDVADVPDAAAELRAGAAGGGHELVSVQAGRACFHQGDADEVAVVLGQGPGLPASRHGLLAFE